jgi:hypothetical protein
MIMHQSFVGSCRRTHIPRALELSVPFLFFLCYTMARRPQLRERFPSLPGK